jgi:hypothetical protein
MAISNEETTSGDLRKRAADHAEKAERLLKSRWLASHVKGQLHATLALYYATRQSRGDR